MTFDFFVTAKISVDVAEPNYAEALRLAYVKAEDIAHSPQLIEEALWIDVELVEGEEP